MKATAQHGYSGVPLARKLGIKADSRTAVLAAPSGFLAQLTELPAPHTRLRGTFDVIVQFADSRAALEGRLDALIAALDPAGGLWVAWRKRSSGSAGRLGERAVREIVLAAGLVDNKVCAIDETWSALRFVRRLAER